MEEPTMPLIQVRVTEEVCTSTQNKEIVSKLTNATLSIEEKTVSFFNWITIEEICNGEWDIGGHAMTTGTERTVAANRK
jgi:4-oxalocrotonate tautomerase